MAMSRSFGGTSLTKPVADVDLAVRDVLEPGDHAQRRRLAAAGRADHDDEFLVGNFEVDVVHHRVAALKRFDTPLSVTAAMPSFLSGLRTRRLAAHPGPEDTRPTRMRAPAATHGARPAFSRVLADPSVDPHDRLPSVDAPVRVCLESPTDFIQRVNESPCAVTPLPVAA